MYNLALYVTTVLVWGSSFLAVKLQVGLVAAETSIFYRFAFAAALLLVWCLIRKKPLAFPIGVHRRFALLGLLIFSTNFLFIYLASLHIPSGLVSVAFSTVTMMNIFLGALFFGQPIRPRVLLGAAIGLAGILGLFWPEISGFSGGGKGMLGLGLALTGTVAASLGMLHSQRMQKDGLPVIASNAWGMVYGALIMGAATLAFGAGPLWDPRPEYAWALAFSVVFSSVIGFGTYLTLLGRIGADRAAYASVMFPAVALSLSTLLEDYRWSLPAAAGFVLVLIGNLVVLAPAGAMPKWRPAKREV